MARRPQTLCCMHASVLRYKEGVIVNFFTIEFFPNSLCMLEIFMCYYNIPGSFFDKNQTTNQPIISNHIQSHAKTSFLKAMNFFLVKIDLYFVLLCS